MKKLFSLLIVLILCIGCNLFVSGSLAETGNVMMELSDQQRNSIGVLFMEQGKSGSSNYKELIRQLQKISSDIVNESRKTPHKEELLAIDQKYSEEIERCLPNMFRIFCKCNLGLQAFSRPNGVAAYLNNQCPDAYSLYKLSGHSSL